MKFATLDYNIDNNLITLSVAFSPTLLPQIKNNFVGRHYDRKNRIWTFPGNTENLHRLKQLLESEGYKIIEHEEHLSFLFDKEKELMTNQKLKNVSGEHLSNPQGVNKELWNHQKKCFHFAKNLPSAGIFMQMATGKTLVALALIAEHKPDKTLIVCPKAVINVWERQIQEHFSNPKDYVVFGVNQNSKKKKVDGLKEMNRNDWKRKRIIIINYESTWRTGIKEEILNFQPEMIIADESHKIKAHNSKQGKFLWQLGKKAKWRYALTGTPHTQSPLDVFGQYRFLDDSIFGTTWTTFFHRYAKTIDMGNYKKVVDFPHKEELLEKAYQIAFRVLTEDVLDLPDIVPNYIEIDLPSKAKKAYNELIQQGITLLDEGVITAQQASQKMWALIEITSGFLYRENEKTLELHKEKLNALMDIIDATDEKIMVFTNYQYEVEMITNALKKKKMKYGIITGSKKDYENFVEDDDVQILVANTSAAGTGLDGLQKICHIAVYYSLTMKNVDYEQSSFRLKRPGQEHSIAFYYLVAKGTIDEKIHKNLQKKYDMVKQMDEFAKSVFSSNSIIKD